MSDIAADTKNNLRRELLKARASFTPAYRSAAGLAAAQIFDQQSLFNTSQNFACYYPQANEFDTTAIIRNLWSAQKNCFLPITILQPPSLQFSAYCPDDELILSLHHILVPAQPRYIMPAEIEVFLLPMLGFDLQGNRLGMGQGYYDRSLTALVQDKTKNHFILGVGYQAQLVPEIPHQPWDVLLDGVLTEQNFYLFNR
jgi:5-formyltetrahydrofolate cyclo-ligase